MLHQVLNYCYLIINTSCKDMGEHMEKLLREIAIKGSFYLVYAILIALLIIKFISYVYG
jgi:hypothetical protein